MKNNSVANKFSAVILAAGEGIRMFSETPKVLHTVGGVPIIERVLEAVRNAGVRRICVVLGHGKSSIQKFIKSNSLFSRVTIVYQHKQRGSAHAFSQAKKFVSRKDTPHCLVLCGDTPLIQASTLHNLMELHIQQNAAATILSAHCEDPFGYGRIVRDRTGSVTSIIEEKDASRQEKKINEINSGMYCFRTADTTAAVAKIQPNNAKKEYYLTDAVRLIREEGGYITAYGTDDFNQIMGINDRVQLAQAENALRCSIIYNLMRSGVTITDPGNTYVEPTVKIGNDTILLPGVILQGSTAIGRSCVIGPYSYLKDAVIEDDVTVNSSYVFGSRIRKKTTIGPYARVRPGCTIGPEAKIGNFVEVKASRIEQGVKAGHLAYLGDAHISRKVNIGAGTIICNYDGVRKYKTEIGEEAFIGSNASLVAPVRIGKKALIAAGSTITDNVAPNKLAIARCRQVVKNRKKR